MKSCLAGLSVLLSICLCVQAADTIAQWNFNSVPADEASGSGTTNVSSGSGLASLVGGTTATFATGDSKADPASADNSAWNTSHYPAAAAGNLSAGVRFDVDTTGYETIQLSWSQRHSGTASRYTRLQYTIDGAEFTNADVFVGGQSFTNLVVDLSAIPGAADNPRFGFRIVAEFESSAIGFGLDGYVATDAGNYGTGGTIRFDMVTVSGTPIPGGNTPPVISAIADRTIRVGSSSVIAFTVDDPQEGPWNLALVATSSDAMVVPESGLILEGQGTERTLTLTAGEQPGTTTITVSVADSGGLSASARFQLTVLPLNTPPQIVAPARTNTVAGVPVAIAVHAEDRESGLHALQFAARSANPDLIAHSGILLQPNDTNVVATISSIPGRAGISPVIVSVSDGALDAEARIGLLVTPDESTLLVENFDYADGSLLTNSAYWQTRSGTLGEATTIDGCLRLSSEGSEDPVARLSGAPYVATNPVTLFSSFRMRAVALNEKPALGYFAHFADGSTLRGRVFAGTSNSPSGTFRLLVANGSTDAAEFPRDLLPGTWYRVVLRYSVAEASTALWVDPASESDEHTLAWDSLAPARVTNFGFRQDDDLCGEFEVDDLRVGTTFSLPTGLPRLACEASGGAVILTWADPSFWLETAVSADGPWVRVDQAASPHRVDIPEGTKFFRLAK